MKNKQYSTTIVLLAFIIGSCFGFFAGMEYKAYQVRKAFADVGKALTGDQPQTIEQKKNEKIIQKQLNDGVKLATIDLKVLTSEEKQTLSVSYGSPLVAKEARKFVIVTVEITNTTNEAFNFYPEGIKLVDDKNRAYDPYSDSWDTENSIDGRDLAPDLKENGKMIFEVPQEIDSYSLLVGKAGTNELYKISVK